MTVLLPCALLFACQSNTSTTLTEKPSIASSRLVLKAHFDKTNDQWISDDPQYSTNAFSDSTSRYATVTRLDSVTGNGKIGLINRNGEIMVPPIYDQISVGFTDSLCQVMKDGKWGMVDMEGKEVVKPMYEHLADHLEDGLLRAGKDGLFGMFNRKGEMVIPLMYSDVQSVGEGLVAVMTQPQRWGFVNLKNEMILQPEFTFVERFVNGQAVLQKTDAENYIVYSNGKVVKKEQ